MSKRNRFDLTEQGAVLILVAMLCVLLVALLGLALDSSLMSSGKDKQERIAEYAALAALEEYQATAGSGTPHQAYVDKTTAAKTRAEKVAGLGANFLVTESVSSAHRAAGQLTFAAHQLPSNVEDGEIRFGIWYFSEAPGVGDCGTGANFSPCFVENDPATATQANAVRIGLRARESWAYTTLFVRLLGGQSVRLGSSATAAIQPRRVVIGLDMSGSSDDASHGPRPLFPNPTKSAFRVVSPPNCVNPAGTPVDVTPSPCPYSFALDLATSGTADHDRWVDDLATNRADYRCIPVQYDDPSPTAHSVTEHYLIDFNNRPEPLYSVLDAVQAGMLEIQRRAVKGDAVGFFGYDHDILEKRRTPGVGVPGDLIHPDDAEFGDWLTATDTGGGVTAARIRDYLMFIRLDDNPSPGFPAGSFTNLPKLINYGRAILAAGVGALGADNHIVNFTDGLTNCTGTNEDSSVCGIDATALQNSMDDVQILIDGLVNNNITFSNALFGMGRVAAHRVVYKSIDDPQTCMSEGEIRRRDTIANPLPLADHLGPLAFCTGTNYQLCFFPNALANSVVKTGGLWAPILEPCQRPGGGACTTDIHKAEIKAHLDHQCELLAPGMPPPRLAEVSNYTDTTLPPPMQGLGLGRGALQCDALCRSRAEQTQGVLQDIFRGNPYVLVEQLPP